MQEKQLTEKESLELISRMINTAKNTYYESGSGPMLWGFTNMFCFIVAYMNEKVKGFHFPFNPFLLMLFTLIIHLYLDRKESKFKEVTSHFDRVIKYVWVAFGISILVITLVGGYANIGYNVFPPMLTIFAMPTFVTGCITQFIPMIIGGVLCWLLAGISFFTHGPDNHLLAATAATVAWVIPGIILRYRYLGDRIEKHGV